MANTVPENSIVNKEKDGNMNRLNGMTQIQTRNKSMHNEDVKKILSIKRLLESKRKRFFKVSDKNMILGFLKNRYLFNSLTEVMDGEQKVHTLIWLKASGALCQIYAHPGYYQQLKNNQGLIYPNPDFQQIELDVLRTYPHIEDAKHRAKLQQ